MMDIFGTIFNEDDYDPVNDNELLNDSWSNGWHNYPHVLSVHVYEC